MDRRNFLVRLGSVILVLPSSSVLLNACGGDDSGATPGAGGAAGSGATTGGTGLAGAGGASGVDAGPVAPAVLTFTSSVTNAHTHAFQIAMTELTSPPAVGIARETSETNGHTHTVVLSDADLGAIQNGQTVLRTTSLVNGHTHQFAFVRT